MDSEASGGSSRSDVTLTDAVVRTQLGTLENPRHLLRTPAAAEAEGGPRDRNRAGATMRLSDQIREELEDGNIALLPTPVAQPSGNTPAEHLRKKPGRMVVTDLAIIAENGLLETGGRLLPTPNVAMAEGVQTSRSGDRKGEPLLGGIAVEQATDWGPYAAAIERWEQVIGRPAPAPVRNDGKHGKPRLNPELTEWMMGWPLGWVTAAVFGLKRSEQLKACGNGVVTMQAAWALRDMLARPGVPHIHYGLAA